MKLLAHRRQRATFPSAIVVAIFSAIPAWSQAVPCIDTKTQGSFFLHRTVAVQQTGQGEIAITGMVKSLNPATAEVGLEVSGLAGTQNIKIRSIRLGAEGPSMMAQMPLPVTTPLMTVSRDFPISDLSVDQGVIRYPDCVGAQTGHEIAFIGTLTFQGDKLRVDGQFVDYAPPSGGGDPGTSQKRG